MGVNPAPARQTDVDAALSHDERVLDVLARLAAFERDLRRERVVRVQQAARAGGKPIGRQPGQRPKADKLAPEVLTLAERGASRYAIAERLLIERETVVAILACTRTRA